MGIYIFQNPADENEVVEIVQTMNEKHEYSKDGISWFRVFTAPLASVDTSIDPLSARDFASKTANKRETLGDIWDRSREVAIKRTEMVGKDTVKEKYYESWSKTRRNRLHPNVRKEKAKNKLNKLGVDVE